MVAVNHILLVFLLSTQCKAICYHCFSSDASLEPKVRTHLGTQEDVFIMPIISRSSSCSMEIQPDYPGVEGQLCSDSSLCVTLMLNVEYPRFVVRGCLEYILRYRLKKEDIHKEGCYIVRSFPSRYSSNFTMEYVLCVCDGDYCNGKQPPDFVSQPLLFPERTVHRLTSEEGVQRFEVSSSVSTLLVTQWVICLSQMFF
ncbi:hypothetical protein DICVIV_02346 [Dictyocaulus viviparus]|uniref:Protein quiver n=1 Tax=Dictyocaulus viviparus TaxID=29172 RepID=A0A0D8Y3R0_DICVI|nr:hypothetical protein DICVIV_02346 [Dictyocaulus viviparus]